MADATKQPESNNSHPLVVDTYIRFNHVKMLVMIVMSIVLLTIPVFFLVTNTSILNNPNLQVISNVISTSLVIISIILSKRIMTPLIKSRISKLILQHKNLSIENQIVTLFSSSKLIAVTTFLQEFAKSLVERGHNGVTIRSCPPKDITTINPFNITFEPLLLDETDETIIELENTLNTDDPIADSTLPVGENLVTNMIPPHLRRNIKFAGGWGVFIFLFIVALLINTLAFITGAAFFHATVITISLLMIIFGVRIGSTLGRRQWLIVPGGFIVREGKFFSQGCELHLFDRRTSVLIVHKIDKQKCSLFAAKENTCQFALVTRKESELLLRAWLSPIPPPLIEQLSDLL